MEKQNIFYDLSQSKIGRGIRRLLVLLALLAPGISLLTGCIKSEDDDTFLLLAAALTTVNTATPLQAACNQTVRTINGITAGQFLTFTSNPSTSGAANTHISFATGTMTLTDAFALASVAANMTAANVELYAGDNCAAVNTSAVTSRLTGCAGAANLASCLVTTAGSYVFQITYSTSVTDMQVSIGTP